MALAGDASADPPVRAVALGALKDIAERAPAKAADLNKPYALQAQLAAVRVAQFLADPTLVASDPLVIPPGSPIGSYSE